MYIKQEFAVTFILRKNKRSEETGLSPVYCRMSVDGVRQEMALRNAWIKEEDWDPENKIVRASSPTSKKINQQIARIKVDLERHFDLEQAKNGRTSAEAVITAYKTPVKPVKDKEDQIAALAFAAKLDEMVGRYVKFCKKYQAAYEFKKELPSPKAYLLEQEKIELEKEIARMEKEGNQMFDKTGWIKTLSLACSEHLIYFMSLVKSGHRAFTTLEKMWLRNHRLFEFLEYRHKRADIPLHEIKQTLIQQYKDYNMIEHRMQENSVCKYTQDLKDTMDRAVASQWIPANVFVNFKSTYKDPDIEWLTPVEMDKLRTFDFSKPIYNLIRDCYVFEAYTGYAYSEGRSASPDDMMIGIDGKLWGSKNRRKTGSDETLPFLPIILDLIEKYKDHPTCKKRGTLMPVPTNIYYNRCLKYMAAEAGIKTRLTTHTARYFFANEVLFNFGIPLKTIAKILGQKSVKSAEKYVRANRTRVSESMDLVEKQLFRPDGRFRADCQPAQPGGRVVSLRVV